MSGTFKYLAIEVKQTPHARPFYLFKATASDILKWCDVPRKKEEFLAGYQRELGNRHESITEFLQTEEIGGNNIIPSSIIIASRNEYTKIKQLGDIANGVVEIEINVNDIEFNALIERTISEFKLRLSSEELASITLENSEIDSEEESEEDTPPDSYLATIVKQLQEAGENLNNLDENKREVIKSYVEGIAKPGLILDGQHRVFGAKNVSQFMVELPIVLLPGLEFSEQVFQFYVLNNKAKPLNKGELRAIVSTSLSNKEISNLYNRFKQVGVTAEETEWTHKMNVDSNSPFRGLIDFSYSTSKPPIPENVAYQVASKFLKPNRKYRLIFKDVIEWGQVTSDYSFRIELFYAFWRAIRDKFPNAWKGAVDKTNGQILQKVSLIILQEYLFDQFANDMPRRGSKKEPSPFSSSDYLYDEVKLQLTYLSEEFFTKEWKAKGLDTGPGHKLFRESIVEAITSQSANLGNKRLFRAI
jgi:DGQHR domain-containing protein